MATTTIDPITLEVLNNRLLDPNKRGTPVADLDRFGALAVGPQIDAGRLGVGRHRRDVCLQRVEIEQQRWGVKCRP